MRGLSAELVDSIGVARRHGTCHRRGRAASRPRRREHRAGLVARLVLTDAAFFVFSAFSPAELIRARCVFGYEPLGQRAASITQRQVSWRKKTTASPGGTSTGSRC